MTERYSCWSITINNPTETDTVCDIPGWKLTGQYEQGAEGTRHFQGMLETGQQRFSTVKRAFPRAHIEPARNKKALQAYIHKEETRVDVYTPGDVPSIFQYQTIIVKAWNKEEFASLCENVLEDKLDELALSYVDTLVRKSIEAGQRGGEWIGINPMWRSSWKKFWRSIIKRHDYVCEQIRSEESHAEEQEGTQGQGSETN